MTALILIPATDSTVNRRSYVKGCIEEAIKQGYAPLICHEYLKNELSLSEYLQKMIHMANIVLVFQDFASGEWMIKVVRDNYPETEIRRMKLENPHKYANTLSAILEDVSEGTGISTDDMKCRTRKRTIVDARFIYFRRAKEITDKSLSEIGCLVGRDHSSVIYGIHQAHNITQVIKRYEELFENK